MDVGNLFKVTIKLETEEKKCDWPRNILLMKNPQFLPNYYETWSK